MRIGVIGAGALGSLFAARLALAGHEVQLVARGEQLRAIAANGIHLHGGFGEAHLAAGDRSLSVGERLDGIELALICTKANDAAGALEAHRSELDTVPLAMVQNGIDGLGTAQAAVPNSELFGVISLIAANISAPGEVTVTNPQPSFVGRGTGPADVASRELARILNQAVPCEAIDDFEGALWTKLVLNMVNAPPAITGLSVQEVAAEPSLLAILTASMREAAQIGIASGVRFARLHELDPTLVTQLAEWPIERAAQIPLDMARGMGPVPNLASMLQSIRRGRLTEVEYLNGAVVRTAEAHGLDAPVNRALTAIVHEVETTGIFLSPEQLRDALQRRGVPAL